jgi:group I intron endonuclease
MTGVYGLRNAANGKLYVGQSQNVEERLRKHREKLRRGAHVNPHLQASASVYGPEVFEGFLLAECEPEDLTKVEQFYTNIFHGLLYNIRDAADSNRGIKYGPRPPAWCKAISEGNKGRNLTPETRAKMSAAKLGKSNPHKGHPQTLETRLKISRGNTGNKRSKEATEKTASFHRGRKHTAEHTAKIAAQLRGRVWTDEQRANQRAIQQARRAREATARNIIT